MAGGLEWKPMTEFPHAKSSTCYAFRVVVIDCYNDALGEETSHHYDVGQYFDSGLHTEITGMGAQYDFDKTTGKYVAELGMYIDNVLTHFAVINEPEA